MRYPTRLDQLNQFDGDLARMDVGREFAAVYPQAQPEKASITLEGSFNSAAEMHVRNFLDCVRSRKEPNATVEKGFQAALVVQLANRSLEAGRRGKGGGGRGWVRGAGGPGIWVFQVDFGD